MRLDILLHDEIEYLDGSVELARVRAFNADGSVLWTGIGFPSFDKAVAFREGMQAGMRLVNRAAYDEHKVSITDERGSPWR